MTALADLPTETIGLSFEADQQTLLAVLEKAAYVVPSRDTLPVLKNFYIEVKPKSIFVTATDLELSVVASSEEVAVSSPGVGVFPARKLLDIVKESDSDVSISVSSGVATISSGRAEWTLPLMDKSEYPSLPDIADVTLISVDRAQFTHAIKSVAFAAAHDTVQPPLMMIDVTDKKMRAADGVRFQQIEVDDFTENLQIPISAVDDLMKIMKSSGSDYVQVGQTETSLVFWVGDDVFLAQKSAAIFPDVTQVLLKPALANDIDLYVDSPELIAAIRRVRINADLETSSVALRLTTDAMLVIAKDPYGSAAKEVVDTKYSGDPRTLVFNHAYLLDMLAAADSAICHFRLGKGSKTKPSPLLLVDEDTGMVGVLNQMKIDFLA